MKTYWIPYRPIRESLPVAEVSQVVHVTEEFLSEFWIVDEWNRTELI